MRRRACYVSAGGAEVIWLHDAMGLGVWTCGGCRSAGLYSLPREAEEHATHCTTPR
jgi:hypothetical protein